MDEDDYEDFEDSYEYQEEIDGPLHIIPFEDHVHCPFSTCWCRPRYALFCVCHTIAKGNTNPNCVMCLGTGYVEACKETANVVVHLDAAEREHRDLKDMP